MPVSISGTNGVTFPDSSLQAAAASPYVLKNRIINGAMVVDQRNAGASVASANGFITDRWSLGKYDPTGGSYSGQQVSDAPTGFKNSLKVTVTANISQAADQYWQAFQIIEGYNIADLGFGTSSPSQITVSFWVKSSVTGTYSIAFFNEGVGGVPRAYVTTYVINTANTWEQKSVTITGDGVSGAGYWGSTNTAGLGLYFDLGCGTNQQATANTWTSGNVRRVSGTVRLMNTSSATWQITGVQLEQNTSATPFERRMYGQELANCQRYYYRSNSTSNYSPYGFGWNASSTTGQAVIQHPVQMRVNPTSIDYSLLSSTVIGVSEALITTATLSGESSYLRTTLFTSGTGFTTGFFTLTAKASTSSYLGFSAEL